MNGLDLLLLLLMSAGVVLQVLGAIALTKENKEGRQRKLVTGPLGWGTLLILLSLALQLTVDPEALNSSSQSEAEIAFYISWILIPLTLCSLLSTAFSEGAEASHNDPTDKR